MIGICSFSARNWVVFLVFVTGGAGAYLAGTLALGEPEARNWLTLFQRLISKVSGRIFRRANKP